MILCVFVVVVVCPVGVHVDGHVVQLLPAAAVLGLLLAGGAQRLQPVQLVSQTKTHHLPRSVLYWSRGGGEGFDTSTYSS